MMLQPLTAHYSAFAALAESWLASGARTFGIWKGQRLVAQWPADRPPEPGDLAAPLLICGATVAELRVAGLHSQAARLRLQAEAELVARLIGADEELRGARAELKDSQEQMLALYELSQSIRNHSTIEHILRHLASEARRYTRARACFAVFLADDGAPTLARDGVPVDEAVIWQLFWRCRSGERACELSATDALPAGWTNAYVLPIRAEGTVVAALGVLDTAGHVRHADRKLLGAMTHQAGLRLERALQQSQDLARARLQSELELARRVHQRLLSHKPPEVHGLDISAASRPALDLGGDFYDFVCQPGRPFVFAVGDVTGKGLSAALLMTMTRSSIHSKASFAPRPQPDYVLRNANEDLYGDFAHVGMFATAFVGQYQPEDGQLIYANAGHSPVIYRPAGGKPQLLRADNTALGILPGTSFVSRSVAVRPGDLLVVATDGFSDARGQGDEPFGHARLLRLVDALADRPAQAISHGLFEAVDRYGAGRPQDDDETLVVIKGAAA
ncbi:MAG TPA: SpoIIE family protein phosphatase [Roseiflexaceae bacterium]|nr:SpoIIE family protein phosphatase [Roseiflexaceae bacterium]